MAIGMAAPVRARARTLLKSCCNLTSLHYKRNILLSKQPILNYKVTQRPTILDLLRNNSTLPTINS